MDYREKAYLWSTIKAGLVVGVLLFFLINYFVSLKWASIVSIGYVLLYWVWELNLKHKIK